ncbi:MAG: hypothetical protein B7O98_00500 [Zestosphaera tikiterensis]|uniref:Uncharacterized protein n=1 Tax=Zestosphaera tikiterensis TaxID=1973259 RepID=A0A2R7Y8T4_9CREN|nr:MAG: hypothetical protein B7O98_00500 [Zestosphaera tikiterensis]
MARETEEERATIVGKLSLDEVSLSKLINLMRLFRDAVEYAHALLFRVGVEESEVKRKVTGILSNAWYANSAIKVAKLYKEQERIKLRKPLLYSVGCSSEKGNRNIRLVATDKALIKIPHADGRHEWIKATVKFGRRHLPLIQELMTGSYSYGAGITIKLKSKRENWRKVFRKRLYLYLNIPIELYLKYFEKKHKVQPDANFYAGFDFNVDRINMAIVDSYGRLRDVRNAHFPEVVTLPREKAKVIRQESLSRLLEYAVAHGVRYFAVEKLKRPSENHGKVGRWSLREYLQQMKILVKKVNGVLIEVNPAYTSIDATAVALSRRIDIHTASAYLIALRGIERYV